MYDSPLDIDGIDILVEGCGDHTVVLIHGWPDSHRLWDSTVEALKGQYRCVRFTLPGFDMGKPARAPSLAQMTHLIHTIVDTTSPDQPVTLLLHDWGCTFGYEYAAQHPQRVARLVAVDIGDHNSPAFSASLTASAKLQILVYQLWLAIAWKLGGALGDRMTRAMARALRCRVEPSRMGWQMNYPYAMQWFGLNGGLRHAMQVAPHCPTLYLYAERKPFMFHSPQWIAQLAQRPGSAVQAFGTGHWVMVEQPAEFNACVTAWLNSQAPTSTFTPAAL
ncbi:MAG: alpha/beta hydrolase [Rhodoferax sp.]|nr:alpha/beta hydrolase [Rhodoferax sp.]MDP3654093.1 alpha/beta hydrolase [Rhodoferax sp.]